MPGHEARRGVGEPPEAAREDPGRGEQPDGQRHLQHHQQLGRSQRRRRSPAPGGPAALRQALQRRGQVCPGRGTQRRQQSGEHAGGEAEKAGEAEHASIQAQVDPTRRPASHAGEGGAQVALDQPDLPGRQEAAEGAAEQGEQHALGEHLTHQPRPAGAERGAHAQLAPAAGGAAGQEVGDAGAAEQQQQADEHRQAAGGGHQALAIAQPDEGLVGADFDAPRRAPGVLAAQPAGERAQCRSGLPELDTRPQPSHQAQPAEVAVLQQLVTRHTHISLLREGHVDLGRDAAATEALGGDPDHRERHPVQEEAAAQDGRAAVACPAPETVTEHGHALGAGAVILDAERTPPRHAGAQHREEVAADQVAPDVRGVGADLDRGAEGPRGREAREHRGTVTVVQVVGVGGRRPPGPRRADVDPDQSFRMRHRQLRPEQEVEVAELRRGGADDQRETADRDHAEARPPRQRAHGVTQIGRPSPPGQEPLTSPEALPPPEYTGTDGSADQSRPR